MGCFDCLTFWIVQCSPLNSNPVNTNFRVIRSFLESHASCNTKNSNGHSV